MKLFLIWCFIITATVVVSANKSHKEKSLESNNRSLHRQKRLLVYYRGANLRLACGWLYPTFIPKWQNINNLFNWSVGFGLPTLSKDWFKKFDGLTSRKAKESRDFYEEGDNTRQRFYNFIEQELEKWGRSGQECLLRAICETAEAPIKHNGLIGELFHVFFTPGNDEPVTQEYKIARKAGMMGANCAELYQNCPFGHGLLDFISVLGHQTSNVLNKYFSQ